MKARSLLTVLAFLLLVVGGYAFIEAVNNDDSVDSMPFRGDMEMNGVHRDDVDYENPLLKDDEKSETKNTSKRESRL